MPALIAQEAMQTILGDALHLNEERARRYQADPYAPYAGMDRDKTRRKRKPH